MTVVSNASPLIVLAKVGWLHLLEALFGGILISRQVFEEVVVTGAGLPGADETAQAHWIRVVEVPGAGALLASAGRAGLAAGELSTIRLAQLVRADLVLLDERRARNLARHEGLKVQGSIGVLEAGFRKGHLPDLREAYVRLLGLGVYLDRALLNASLTSCNLTPL